MTDTDSKSTTDDFLQLTAVLNSLVDFIRPETFIAQDELETYHELKEKSLRDATMKRKKSQGQSNSSSLELAGLESIRSTSGIYRFLAHHHKNNPSTVNTKQKPSISREELLKKLHEKMPHRQQNGNGSSEKRKREKEKPAEKTKKIRTKIETSSPVQPVTKGSSLPRDLKPSVDTSSAPIVPQLTFGRFEFNTEETSSSKSKKKPMKKFQSKDKQLKSTLKKLESEQEELQRLREENPEESKEILRSKHWKTAMAKAKGEKLRDNAQLLRKTIKKEQKRRVRSAKKWKENKAQTDKRMKEKQEKRQTNLKKRKDEKKAKIKKRLIKKGRLIS